MSEYILGGNTLRKGVSETREQVLEELQKMRSNRGVKEEDMVFSLGELEDLNLDRSLSYEEFNNTNKK